MNLRFVIKLLVRVLAPIFFILLLSGCLTTQSDIGSDPKSVAGFMKKSQMLIDLQQWEQAELLLKRALRTYPENQIIQVKLESIQQRWGSIKQRLEDWLVVYDVEAKLRQRPLLLSMTQSESNSYKLRSRLSNMDSKLKKQRKLLVICAENQINKNVKLAKRCIEAANSIRLTLYLQELLSSIERKQKSGRKLKQRKAAKQLVLDKNETRRHQLLLVRSLLKAAHYHQAEQMLAAMQQLIEKEGSPDQEVNILMGEAISGRDLQVLKLMNYGDWLYREERTLEALNVWQDAAKLDIEHLGLIERINRAEKVLRQLNKIRSKGVEKETKEPST